MKMVSKFYFFGFLLFINVSINNVMPSNLKKEVVVDARPEVAEARGDIENSKSMAAEIIEKEPFVNVTEEKLWRFKEEDEEVDVQDSDILNALIAFMAMLIEASLWLLIVLVFYFLYRYREYWLNLIQGETAKKITPDLPNTLFGLDVAPENLPDDIEIAAKELWQKQQYREAISLLYRGSLASLFKLYEFDLPEGATEHDCIRQLESNYKKQNNTAASKLLAAEDRINKFKRLTNVWVNIAYAHKFPDDVVFNDLCENWNQNFTHKPVAIS